MSLKDCPLCHGIYESFVVNFDRACTGIFGLVKFALIRFAIRHKTLFLKCARL